MYVCLHIRFWRVFLSEKVSKELGCFFSAEQPSEGSGFSVLVSVQGLGVGV